MASSTTKTTVNRHQLYRVTYTILNSNSLLFLSISLLFLPLTVAASATLRFYFSSGTTDVITTEFDPFNTILLKTIIASSQNLKTLTTSLAFTASVILSTVAGTALITSATHHAIHRQPLTFSSSFQSLSHSFLPLLHTLIAGSVTLILLFLAFTLSSIAITKAITFHFNPFFFIFLNSILSFVLSITVVFCIVIWGSAAAITVLESKSGFAALRQSANQPTEFRYTSFSIVYVTGFVIGSALSYVSVSQYFGVTANWILNLQTGALCLQSSLMILLYVVANTVLYVQCKVERGRRTVPVTVEGEFSGEDVKLVVNDKEGEVFSELLSKKEVNGGFVFSLFLLSIIWVLLLFVQIVFLP